MKRLIFSIVMASILTGCGKHQNEESQPQQNTEEYFRAHGIVPGQPNELRIGGTLFRFPAGVGLNPYTETGIRLLADGGKGIPLDKEPRKIVKGQADSVTFYLDAGKNFAPGPDPFPMTGQVIQVAISKTGHLYDPEDSVKKIKHKSMILEHPEFALREYRTKNEWDGEWDRSIYESTLPQIRGIDRKIIIGCIPHPDTCAMSYWQRNGNYSVTIQSGKNMIEHWQEIYPAVVHFVDSVVVK